LGVPILEDDSLPAAFRSADLASRDGQSHTLDRIRWALALGVIAALTGLTSWRIGKAGLDPFAAIGAACFIGSLVLVLKLSADQSERGWYLGRAIAESIKTLAWRYAVGGDPFPIDAPERETDREFLQRTQEVIARGKDLTFVPVAGEQISAEMRAIRHLPLTERRESYRSGRIQDQRGWYTDKASDNASSAKRWGYLTITANCLGIAGATARFFGWVDVDLLGLAAAVAGATTAWMQVKQHRVLAASYAMASQDLGLVMSRLDLAMDDGAWALEVSDAEDAISREHTMWLARHGHPSE
jgi:hypothetical protein